MDTVQKVEAEKSASTPLILPVRFVGGSKDGLTQQATFRVTDEGTLFLMDIRATFGDETYKYNAQDRTFELCNALS